MQILKSFKQRLFSTKGFVFLVLLYPVVDVFNALWQYVQPFQQGDLTPGRVLIGLILGTGILVPLIYKKFRGKSVILILLSLSILALQFHQLWFGMDAWITTMTYTAKLMFPFFMYLFFRTILCQADIELKPVEIAFEWGLLIYSLNIIFAFYTDFGLTTYKTRELPFRGFILNEGHFKLCMIIFHGYLLYKLLFELSNRNISELGKIRYILFAIINTWALILLGSRTGLILVYVFPVFYFGLYLLHQYFNREKTYRMVSNGSVVTSLLVVAFCATMLHPPLAALQRMPDLINQRFRKVRTADAETEGGPAGTADAETEGGPARQKVWYVKGLNTLRHLFITRDSRVTEAYDLINRDMDLHDFLFGMGVYTYQKKLEKEIKARKGIVVKNVKLDKVEIGPLDLLLGFGVYILVAYLMLWAWLAIPPISQVFQNKPRGFLFIGVCPMIVIHWFLAGNVYYAPKMLYFLLFTLFLSQPDTYFLQGKSEIAEDSGSG